MKIATGYLPPTAGTVRVAGHDVLTDSLEVRRQVGYLPEHNPLYLDMYVHEYLEFIGSVHGLKGCDLRRRVADMVDRVGLGREQNKQIGALSKGYRQRVGLAQALIHDPGVLILDEPTTGLDPNQIGEIRTLIRELGEDKTVIFTTHILPEVTALCTRVVIISRGKLVADSSVSDLGARAAGETLIRAEFEQAIDPTPLACFARRDQRRNCPPEHGAHPGYGRHRRAGGNFAPGGSARLDAAGAAAGGTVAGASVSEIN